MDIHGSRVWPLASMLSIPKESQSAYLKFAGEKAVGYN